MVYDPQENAFSSDMGSDDNRNTPTINMADTLPTVVLMYDGGLSNTILGQYMTTHSSSISTAMIISITNINVQEIQYAILVLHTPYMLTEMDVPAPLMRQNAFHEYYM